MENQAFELLMHQLKKMEADQEFIREQLREQGIVLVKNTESLIVHMQRTEKNEVLISQNQKYIEEVEKQTSAVVEELKYVKGRVLTFDGWIKFLKPTPKKLAGLIVSITVIYGGFTSFKQWVITFFK